MFSKLLNIHRYYEYLIDLVFSSIYLFLMKKNKNFIVGKTYKFRGIPQITMVKGSSITIGECVYLISRSRNTALGVCHPVIIRTLSPQSNLKIGNNFSASGVTICCACKIEIGNKVMLGANVIIADTDFHSIKPDLRFSANDLKNALTAPIIIEDNVFVGMNVMILKGVKIGQGAIIAAGSIVTRDVMEFTMVGGSPAKLIKYIS